MIAGETAADRINWVLHDLGWALVGAALPAGFMAVANVIMARGLSLAEFGQWTFFTQMAAYAATLLTGPVAYTLSYHLPRRELPPRSLATATLLVALITGIAAAIAVALLAAPLIHDVPATVIWFGVLVAPALSLQFWAFALLDANRRFRDRALIAGAVAASLVVVLAVLVATERLSVPTVLGARALALALAAALAVALGRSGITLRAAPVVPVLARLAVVGSWPVTLTSLTGVTTVAAVLVAVGLTGGPAMVGALGIGTLLTQPLMLSSVAVAAVLVPHGASDDSPGAAHRLRRLGRVVAGAGLVYAVAVSVAIGMLLELLTGEQVSRDATTVALLVLWGHWFKQLAGVDVAVMRSRAALGPGLAVAGTAAAVLPIVAAGGIGFGIASATVAITAGWLAAQVASAAVALALFRTQSGGQDA